MNVLMQQCNSIKVRQWRYEERQLQLSSSPVHPSWLFENEARDSLLRALHIVLCKDLDCGICHGTEEERELENLGNVRLLFRDLCECEE